MGNGLAFDEEEDLFVTGVAMQDLPPHDDVSGMNGSNGVGGGSKTGSKAKPGSKNRNGNGTN